MFAAGIMLVRLGNSPESQVSPLRSSLIILHSRFARCASRRSITETLVTLRRALALTQEEFAARSKIPLGTLRDWEQGRSEPDQPAKAYLTLAQGNYN